MADLEAIKAREAAATAGPWTHFGGNIVSPVGSVATTGISEDRTRCTFHATTPIPHRVPDAVFISHAREDVPALIAEVERLRTLLGDLHRAPDPEPGKSTEDVGLEDELAVPCTTCDAAPGVRCLMTSGRRYPVGYGHSQRGRDLVRARESAEPGKVTP